MHRQIKVVPDLRLSGSQYPVNQFTHIRLVGGGEFPGNRHVVVLDHGLDSHTALVVMAQAIAQDRVRNLVAEFVGMPGGYLFTGKKHVFHS